MFFLSDLQILRHSRNANNQNLKNAATLALSMGYKSQFIRKMSGFWSAFWVRKGRLI